MRCEVSWTVLLVWNFYFYIGDDHQALIWDIQQMPRPIEDPILAYTAAEGAINQVSKIKYPLNSYSQQMPFLVIQ